MPDTPTPPAAPLMPLDQGLVSYIRWALSVYAHPEHVVAFDGLLTEREALLDWKRTILNAPGEAREIAAQRFADSEAIKPIVDAWRQKLAAAESHLGNLLARIHRDGGHYQDQHGTEKAVADADVRVVEMIGAETRVAMLEKVAEAADAILNSGVGNVFDRRQRLMDALNEARAAGYLGEQPSPPSRQGEG